MRDRRPALPLPKESFRLVILGFCLAVAGFVSRPAFGQIPGGDKGNGALNAALVKLVGIHTNFVSKVEARVLDKDQKETDSVPMVFDMLAGQIRLEINLSELKSKELSPEVVSQMKALGINRMITVQLNDKKADLFISPDTKSYTQTPMSKEELESLGKVYKIEKTRVGKEAVDGRSCEKDSVTITDDKGAQQKATVWFASEPKDFPVQIRVAEDADTLIMHFKDVKLGRPDPALFEAPAGMTKFDGMEALMSDAAIKKMNPAAAK